MIGNIVYDEWISFPLIYMGIEAFNELVNYCGSIKKMEECFDIEFSCGDGKFYSDLLKQYEQGKISLDDLNNYENKFDLYTKQPRFPDTKCLLNKHKWYHFHIIRFNEIGEERYYLNNRDRYRKFFDIIED